MSGNVFSGAGASSSEFLQRADGLQRWIADRLYLCGGWSAELEQQYAPRLHGVYQFDAETSEALRRLAAGLGRLYARLGMQIGSKIRALGLPPSWPLDHFGSDERDLIDQFHDESNWATTLRADIVLDGAGRPWVVEVNSDNVGGLEDLMMMLGWFQASGHGGASGHAAQALQQLQDCYLGWLRAHHAAHRRRRDLPPQELEDAVIAIVADDMENSSALSRVLAAYLGQRGIQARPCRPSQLRSSGGGIEVAGELGDAHHSVDIVLRDMLWHELFSSAPGLAEPTLRAPTRTLLTAAAQGQVLLLNPPTERLLFSKAILAELCTGAHGVFDLDNQDREFVQQYIPRTEYLQTGGRVLKPSSLCGGQGVFIGGGAAANEGSMPWVLQERVQAERVRTWYRDAHQPVPVERDLFVVHGLLIYGAPGQQSQLAGVMTRIGPDPVVNFSRGAQIVPGLLSAAHPPPKSEQITAEASQ